MKRFIFYFLVSLLLVPCTSMWAQPPTLEALGTYYLINEDGEEETGDVNGQTLSAPFRVVFTVTPTIPDGYKSQVWYEWTLRKANEQDNILLRRNDESFEYDFNESGSYIVQLRAIFYGEEGVEDYEFPNEEEGVQDFEVTDDISMRVEPAFDPGLYAVSSSSVIPGSSSVIPGLTRNLSPSVGLSIGLRF